MREGWEIKKLGDIADLQRGLTYSKGDEVSFSSKRVLRSNNIDLESSKLDLTELKYLREDFVIPEDRKVKKNSIFICMSNGSKQHVGKVAFINDDIDYAFGGFMGLIVPQEGITPKYVFYSCLSPAYRLFLSSIGNGIGITNLRFTDLANFTLPVPPVQEQEKIVAELDCLSGIIEKKKQQLKELDNLAQSIFYDMFGDPITNEKGWEVKEISSLFDVGSSKRVFEAQWRDKGVPFYRAREIVRLAKGEPIEDPIFVEEALYKEYSVKYGVPRPNDMMITGVGTLGVCYIVKAGDRFYFKDGNILWFKQKGLCETRFIKEQYATDYVMNQIKGNANIVTVGTYTITNANKTKVIVPPLELQKQFVNRLEAIDRQKELVKRSIVETETLFNSRMDFWFNNKRA